MFFELFVGMQWMNRQRMCVRRIPLFMLVSIIDFKFSLQQENKAGKNRKRRPKVSLIPRLTTEEKPISSVMDPGRSPCPYRLVDDTGGAFMIGRAVVVAILILGEGLFGTCLEVSVILQRAPTFREWFMRLRRVLPCWVVGGLCN